MDGEKPFWESSYGDPDADTFGPPADEIVEVAAALPEGARVLDLGCGDGRNALCLAEQGLRVHAVDVSERGIRKLRGRAHVAGLSVRAWVQDIKTFSFGRDYDLVVAHGVLHLLERDVSRRILELVRRHTCPGGWNIVAVFTDRLPSPPDLAPHMHGLFRETELLEWYDDWFVEQWEAYTLEDEHPGGVRHTHPVNKLVARQPKQ